MKTWTLKISEEEMRALITHHNNKMFTDQSIERSSRIYDLTKRLNKDTPEIENAEQAQPQSEFAKAVNAAPEASKASGW